MIHLGDITKISGYAAPIVDCIIGGSPCQDLSVAGKRAGLDGERSGLYMEQIRIVKEMREQDERNGRTGVNVRPRYMVWENVPGAFSSNKGEDFRIVLEELAKIADKDAVIPMPDKGKWTTCGCIMGDGWSIAWRVLDAQFWGVPQRRRRIALVADFGGQSAPEILLVRESVSGHTDESQPQRKEAATDASRGVGADNRLGADQYNAVILGDTVSTLGVNCGMSHGRQCVLEPQVAYTLKIRSGCEGGGKGALIQTEKSATLSTLQDQTLFQPVVYEAYQHHGWRESEKIGTLTATQNNHVRGDTPLVCTFSKAKRSQTDNDYETWKESDTANTFNAFDTGDVRTSEVVIALDRAAYNQGKNAQFDFEVSDKGVNSPLVAKGPGAVCYTIDEKCANTYVWEEQANTLAARDYKQPQTVVAVDCRNGTEDAVNGALQSNAAHSLNGNNVVRTRYIVRRIAPLECERLQGYPDGWTDIGEYTDSSGKKRQTSDAARYKALGNSIALPPWKWVLKRLCACYERDATMASLFDGIGGFPYLWEQLNGKGSCLWASEIDEFPMAVTKVRIGE